MKIRVKRPLLAVCAFLVAVAWLRLMSGGYDSPPDGTLSLRQLEQGAALCVVGQVCKKEEQKIWLQSVSVEAISNKDQIGQNQTKQENKDLCQTERRQVGQETPDRDTEEQEAFCAERLICELEREDTVPLGAWVMVSGSFQAFSEASNPGEFDALSYYRSLGVGGQLKKVVLLGKNGDRWTIREAMYRLRQRLHERLYSVFPEREASVMAALLLGEKSDTDKELKNLYKRCGILHILSISSLHITIIGMSLYKTLRRTGLSVAPCAVAGAVLLLLYGFLTGFSVSACRAIGMYLIRMLGEICGRTYDMLTAVGILAAAMVLYRPFYLENTGFLLSFSAVLGIGALYPAMAGKRIPVQPRYYGEARLRLWLRKTLEALRMNVLSSLAATLATLPVQLWFFYEAPVLAVVINLLVLPFMKPMLIAGLFSLIPGFGTAGILDRGILWWYETLCGLFDGLPFGSWNPGRPQPWQMLIYYMALGGIVLLGRRRRHSGDKDYESKGCEGRNSGGEGGGKGSGDRSGEGRNRGGRSSEGGGCEGRNSGGRSSEGKGGEGRSDRCGNHNGVGLWQAVLTVAAVAIFLIHPADRNQIIFLDVGQGDCCLIRTETGHNYLFDCGSSSRRKVGEYVLLPTLKYYGITTLDGVFVSHPDVDHMNGIRELLELAADNHLTIKSLVLPAVEQSARQVQFGELLEAVDEKSGGQKTTQTTRVVWVSAGDAWESGSVRFLCLHPERESGTMNENAYSECFYVDFGDFTLLLTGDVEGSGEEALLAELQRRGIGQLDLLKTAHHGSRNSTTEEFLQQLHPGTAIISCGSNNRYGHPHAELLNRLESAGVQWICTKDYGAITVEMDKGGGVKMRGYRAEK